MRWCRSALVFVIAGCEPSASSPPEHAGVPDASSADAPCVAAEFPILFHSTLASQRLEPQLFVMRVDGSGAMRVGQGGSFYGAVWSPDGRRIAYRRQSSPTEGQSPSSEIGLLSPGGLERLSLFVDDNPLITPPSYHRPDGPSWSPDGDRLAFASTSDAGQLAIWVVPSSGGEPERLLPALDDPHADPSFAPHDETRLAFVATVDGVQDVWTAILREPSELVNLTNGRVHLPRSPRWSRDETRLAFSASPSQDEADVEEIYVFDFETSELVRVTEREAVSMGPAWSPDGLGLIIGSNPAGTEPTNAPHVQLWRVWLDGVTTPLQLTANVGVSFGADWYPKPACGDDG